MIGYLDLPSGISGDMFLGCLVDAGWPIEQLRAVLDRLKLPPGSFRVDSRPVMRGAMRATLVDVRVGQVLPGTESSPDHHKHPHGHDHSVPDHEHQTSSADGQQMLRSRGHRNLHDVAEIIEASDLPELVKRQAVSVFARLAAAEAKVHGSTVQDVHFHEVGALDAIVDIVGTVAGIQALGIDRLYCSALPLAGGWVETLHGRLPLPAPATLELLAAVKAPTCPAPGPGELVTPTGAALLAELASFCQPPMWVERIGLGAGHAEFDWPNIARLWLGCPAAAQPSAEQSVSPLVLLETNIDDMNPQLYAAVCDRLFAAGARDVWLTPVQMKKARPAVVLSVLCDADRQNLLADLILAETTTLGVRIVPVRRQEAVREIRSVQTRFGPIRVKLKWVGGRIAGASPEYEDCRAAAEKAKVPVRLVHDAALAESQSLLGVARSAVPGDCPEV